MINWSRHWRRRVLPLSEVVRYQSSLTDLVTLTIAELVAWWRSLDLADVVGVAGDTRDFLPALMDGYSPLASDVAAAFYDDARIEADARGAFVAVPARRPSGDLIQATTSWAVAPLFREQSDPELALSRLSGGSQKIVADVARDTVVDSVEQDPAKPTFARHASANACAFCRLVASRGAVYRSARSAGDGHKYHDHCHCVVVPVWDGRYEQPPYVGGWESAYKAALKAVGGSDTKAILAHMRQSLGAA